MVTETPARPKKTKIDVHALAASIRRGLQGPGRDREGLIALIATLERYGKMLEDRRQRIRRVREFLAQLRGKLAIMLPQAKALHDRVRAARARGGRLSPEFRAKLHQMRLLAQSIRDYVNHPSRIPKFPLSPEAVRALKRIDLERLKTGLQKDSPEVYAVCFAAGTPVRMADGVWKPIETVQPGERVLCASENDPEGATAAKRVIQVYHNPPVEICEVHLGDALIRTTPNHPFCICARGWIAASTLRPGDELRSLDGRPVVVTSSRSTGLAEPVFNLQIADQHTYFVGVGNNSSVACGVLVHNQSAPERRRQQQEDRWQSFRVLGRDDFPVLNNIPWDEQVFCEIRVNRRTLQAQEAVVAGASQAFPFGTNADGNETQGNTRATALAAATEWATARVQAADGNFFANQPQYPAGRFMHTLAVRSGARTPAGTNENTEATPQVTATEFRFQPAAVRDAINAWFDRQRTGMSRQGQDRLGAIQGREGRGATQQGGRAANAQTNANNAAATGNRGTAANSRAAAEAAAGRAQEHRQRQANPDAGILQHENGHFRITRAYSNLLVGEVQNLRVVVISQPGNTEAQIRAGAVALLLDMVNARYQAMERAQQNTNNNLYDADTRHNTAPDRQALWNARIEQAILMAVPTTPERVRQLWELLNTLPH